jgi:hypothetical protein
VTEDVLEEAFWHVDCGSTEPHSAHLTTVACCDHEHDTWCWGVPEPESLAEQVAALQPGQRVRVVYEGVVQEPTKYTTAERPAVAIGEGNGHVVLRYTGTHPGRARRDKDPHVDGLLVPTLVAVEVVEP